ncbi:MAG: hypothetical protein H6672_00990 [Anaerolineaceae bacterium]|nr:hypothetical protein [Anaerolineaceae bacterium]
MKWRTAAGQDMEMAYDSIPDGQLYPTDPATGVDSMSMTRVSDRQLDSDARKGDVVVAYATRILSDDGDQMTVKQSGKTPEGHEFTNTSLYVRRAD